MSSGVGKVFKAITLDQFMPWRGDSDPISNLAGNIFMPGVYTGVGMYKEQKEEKEIEAAVNEKAVADAQAAAEAADEKAKSDSLAAAAEAEAEKLRKRKGYKATISTGTNQDSLGAAPTSKAALMG